MKAPPGAPPWLAVHTAANRPELVLSAIGRCLEPNVWRVRRVG